MVGSDERAMKETLVAYLDGRVTRANLHRRFVQISWSGDEAIDPVARDFANAVLLALDEASSGLLDDAELRAEFLHLVDGVIWHSEPVVTTGATDRVKSLDPWAPPVVGFGELLEAASGSATGYR